jgi:hypothetical protein
MNGRIARFNRVGVGLLAVLGLALVMSGQEKSPEKRVGLVTDWTSHHLVFSTPSSPEVAAKVAQDPRYWQQWARRNIHAVIQEPEGEADVSTPEVDEATGHDGFGVRPSRQVKTGMKKDWSLEMASTAAMGDLNYPAKFSFSTSSPSCTDFVVFNTGVAGNAGTESTGTGTLSSTGPTNDQTATIANSVNAGSEEVEASAQVAATATGTFTTTGPLSGSVTINDSSNGGTSATITASPGTEATGTITVSSGYCIAPGHGVTIDGVNVTTNATSATQTVSIGSNPANWTSGTNTVTIGGVTYTFVTSITAVNQVLEVTNGTGGSATTENEERTADNLQAAVNGAVGQCYTGTPACLYTGTGGQPANTLATGSGTSGGSTTTTVTMTANCAGTAGEFVTITDHNGTGGNGNATTLGTYHGASSNGSAGSGTFAIPTSISTTAMAADIAAGVNDTTIGAGVIACTGGGVTPGGTCTANGSSSTVTLSSKYGNPAYDYAVATDPTGGVTGLAVTNMTGAALGTTSATLFAVDGVAADDAMALENAINDNGTIGLQTATVSGAAVTIKATAALGANGNNITLANTLGSTFAWSTSTTNLTGGASLQSGACTGTNCQWFQITDSSGNQLGLSTIAANMVTALTTNEAAADVTIGAPNCATTCTFTVTTTANEGNASISATESMTNFMWSTFTGGTSPSTSIIAYENLYPTCNGGVPTTAWAYGTGGTVTTSPVISLDGSQVAFVQNSAAGAAQLVILKPLITSGEAFNNPGAITSEPNAAAYRSCASDCMYVIPFAQDGSDPTLPSDGLAPAGSGGSSVWEDYAFDVAYVGDDQGYLHSFTGVFTGSPAEVTSGSFTWPVSVCPIPCASNNENSNPLTSPVYDESRGVIYVGDYGGKVDWINVSSSTISANSTTYPPGTVTTTSGIAAGDQDLYDAPLVDPSAGTSGYLYEMVADDQTSNCAGSNPCSGIFQLAGEFVDGDAGTEEATGYTTTARAVYTGSFDNAYYSGTAAGHLYVCGGSTATSAHPTLYAITFSSTAHTTMSAVTTGPALSSAGATCSSITEAYNPTGTPADYIYTSVTTSGSTAGCTAGDGCVEAYNVNIVLTTSSTGAGFLATGGTSGISIDNFVTTTGDSNIYYSPLTTANCTTPAVAGGCAVQVVQGPTL